MTGSISNEAEAEAEAGSEAGEPKHTRPSQLYRDVNMLIIMKA